MHRKLENVFYEVRAPRLSWDDIGGLAGPKAKVKEMVCLPLTKGKELAAMGVDFPAGVMLWGPLGLGITMLAEAAAKEAGVSFVYVSGQEMLGKGEELVEAFDITRVSHNPAAFDTEKLEWLNGHYIQQLAVDDLAAIGDAAVAPLLAELRTLAHTCPKLHSTYSAMRDQELRPARNVTHCSASNTPLGSVSGS